MESWDDFLAPYKQAVEELKVKLKGLRKQFERENIHSPIEFVTGRVKPIVSILDKASQKDIPIDKLGTEIQDIAGLRMMCQFVDDIEQVVELLRGRNDFEIVEERNYISHKKASGYRSYHVVIRYPVQTIHGEKNILAEIQIRTLAMNFWATIEHSLNYKYKGIFPEDIQIRLKRAKKQDFCWMQKCRKYVRKFRKHSVFFQEKKILKNDNSEIRRNLK